MFLRLLLFTACLVALAAASGCDGGPKAATAPEKSSTQDPTMDQQTAPDSSTEENSTDERAVEPSTRASTNIADQLRLEEQEYEKQSIEIPSSWKRLSKTSHIWADVETKSVIVRGSICLQEGLLEMFACPPDTKDHESIVSTHAMASEAHAAFLAMGVDHGKPMVWVGKYVPVTGPIIEIQVWWSENGELKKRRAQEMILNAHTEKAMETDFVFGGSEIYHDTHTKENTYYADSGEFINVTNSPYAMIDIAIESTTKAEEGLLYSALTENVPPINTKVYLVMTPTGKIRKNDPEEAKENPQPAEPQKSDPPLDETSS